MATITHQMQVPLVGGSGPQRAATARASVPAEPFYVLAAMTAVLAITPVVIGFLGQLRGLSIEVLPTRRAYIPASSGEARAVLVSAGGAARAVANPTSWLAPAQLDCHGGSARLDAASVPINNSLQEGEDSVEARRGSRSCRLDGMTVVSDLEVDVVSHHFFSLVARVEGPELGAVEQTSQPPQGTPLDAKARPFWMSAGGQPGFTLRLDHEPIKAPCDPPGPFEDDQSIPRRPAGVATSKPRQHRRHEREGQEDPHPHPRPVLSGPHSPVGGSRGAVSPSSRVLVSSHAASKLMPVSVSPATETYHYAGVRFGLANPVAKRLLMHTQIGRDMRDRTVRLEHEPNRPLAQLIRILPRCRHFQSLALRQDRSWLRGLRQTQRGSLDTGVHLRTSPRQHRRPQHSPIRTTLPAS